MDYEGIGRKVVELVLAEMKNLEQAKPVAKEQPPPVDLAAFFKAKLEDKGPMLLSALGKNLPLDIRDELYYENYRIKDFLATRADLFVVSGPKGGAETAKLIGQADPVEAPNQICKFFASEKGCRFGDKCRRQHGESK